MAIYSPSDAVSYCKIMIKSMPIDTVGSWRYFATDFISSLMWTAAPWRWTLDTLPTTTVVAATIDYPLVVPADFLYLNKANISDGSLTNELKIVASLPGTITQIGNPTQIAALTDLSDIRISPKPPTNYSQTLTMIYKKAPTKIDSSNYSTAGAQVFPDCYFPVYNAGVLWLAYQYADDQRAGGCTVDGEGKMQFTGQLGTFQGMIAEMRKAEKLTLDYPEKTVMHG